MFHVQLHGLGGGVGGRGWGPIGPRETPGGGGSGPWGGWGPNGSQAITVTPPGGDK